MSHYVTSTGAASRWRHARGFTAVELLMVMTVVGILLAIAVPSYRTFMQNSRLTTQANTLVYALNLARSSAIQLDKPVQVCASADGATCNGGGWNQGWIVGYPAAANCAAGGAPTTVLGVSPQLGANNQANEKVNGALTVCYLANGQTNNGIGGTTYQFSFCDIRGAAFGQDVEINFTGRIQSAQTQGQLINGAALAC
jgi:type IV fimbrial biogenesis protein FimT